MTGLGLDQVLVVALAGEALIPAERALLHVAADVVHLTCCDPAIVALGIWSLTEPPV